MDKTLDLHSIKFRKPKDLLILKDDSENWLKFRKVRFLESGDGGYVVIRGLDLSGYDLNHFPADHVAFVQCNLDGASFRSTRFDFETAFINCSIKDVDFGSTSASDTFFLDCDLTGAKFWAETGWSTANLDGKRVPSFFSNCRLDAKTEEFLLKDGCLTDKSEIAAEAKLDVLSNMNDKLYRIITAPILDV